MRTVGEIALSISTTSTLEATQTEIAEHKGFGHPDSLCDGAVEAAACALSRAYLQAYGAIQHFNLDKALLIGGISQPRFGGGKVLRPARLIVCGPVTELPSASATSLVEQSIREYLVATLGKAGNDIGIELVLRPSAPNLQRVIQQAALPLASKTRSFALRASCAPTNFAAPLMRLGRILRSWGTGWARTSALPWRSHSSTETWEVLKTISHSRADWQRTWLGVCRRRAISGSTPWMTQLRLTRAEFT
jgi:S-adenosylmethionine synthetase